MNLAIKEVKSAGDVSHERIVLEASDDTDIGSYAIFVARKGTQSKAVLGGPIRYCFWLPDLKVKKGDLIALYTKKGTSAKKENPSGSTSYFYYWNETDPIWLEGRFAVLLEIQSWDNLEIHQEDLSEEPLSKATLSSVKPPDK
jgi:hypothetical protein